MDTTTWTCPNNPFSHDWNGGTTCRSCTATRTAGQAITSLLAGPEGWDTTRAAALVDQHRAEVLAEAKQEVIGWLVKKAREDTPVQFLASKVDRGAIRLFLNEHR